MVLFQLTRENRYIQQKLSRGPTLHNIFVDVIPNLYRIFFAWFQDSWLDSYDFYLPNLEVRHVINNIRAREHVSGLTWRRLCCSYSLRLSFLHRLSAVSCFLPPCLRVFSTARDWVNSISNAKTIKSLASTPDGSSSGRFRCWWWRWSKQILV